MNGVISQKRDAIRYQNKIELANMIRSRRTMKYVNDIVSTMDSKDKKLLNLTGEEYQTLEEGQYLAKRFIKRVRGVPVSFFDIFRDCNGAAVAIGTRSGAKYRNKGYAKSVAKRGRKWLDKHYNEFDQIVWWTRKENIASIKLAEDNGFRLDKSSVLPNDPWIKYEYKRNVGEENIV